jgi:thiamine kinase-like enzyme
MSVTDITTSQGSVTFVNRDRIPLLPCWKGPIEIALLKGGISNESYVVTDAAGRHVVRFGVDYPFHHVSRQRELMVARSAHAAGFGPEIRYAEPGVMVTEFLGAKTYGAEDVVTNADAVARLLKRFHETMARYVSGTAYLFWPFHVVRDYALTLAAGKSRMVPQLPDYLALAEELERAQVPLPIIFGHNDLLPANILDDGERLWLIDFEYAGYSTAMFDLAGATSNAGFSDPASVDFLGHYLGRTPDYAFLKAFTAMQCTSLLREAMWSMVSELHLNAPGADYVTYTAENLLRLEVALDRYRSLHGKTSA